MFRNVRFYRFDSGWPKTEEESSQLLTTCAFRPCGPLTLRSSGWVAPSPEAGDALVRRVNGADLVRLRSQSRVLPPSAVAEELEHRIEDYVERMREQPSPREKRKMKAEARDELMPRRCLSPIVFSVLSTLSKSLLRTTRRKLQPLSVSCADWAPLLPSQTSVHCNFKNRLAICSAQFFSETHQNNSPRAENAACKMQQITAPKFAGQISI